MKGCHIDGLHGRLRCEQWIMKPKELEEMMRVYWKDDFQIHVHINGEPNMQKL